MRAFLLRVVTGVWALAALCGMEGCTNPQGPSPPGDFRRAMRDFVEGLSGHAKGVNPRFLVIPQNAQELLTDNGEAHGTPVAAYLAAIDGTGREDLFYGYEEDNVRTPAVEREYMLGFTELAEQHGIDVLVVDYCWTRALTGDSYGQSAARGYISFAAPDRDLRAIPAYPLAPYAVNAGNITSLSEARNFLYLLNPERFATRGAYLDALAATDYDLLIIDLFFEDGTPLSAGEVASLKRKANGGSRLVVAYMSIGEAEDYRYYWQASWHGQPPQWLVGENPDWPGNYTVRYWDPGWQAIVFGNDDSYLAKVLEAGFDGVYLDRVDAFELFE